MDSPGKLPPLAQVRPSPIHGKGLFATRGIAAGTRVIEYVGEPISKAESLRRCERGENCIFALSDEQDLDGNLPGNPARFLNHSCMPNCEAIWENGRIWIVARRNIKQGKELTFNYGYDLVDYREHRCCCGASQCVGYIVAEEFFEHVRSQRGPSQLPRSDLCDEHFGRRYAICAPRTPARP